MIHYPYLQEQPSSRRTVDVFRGLNRNERIGEGEFCDMQNLTSDYYPVLSPREMRTRLHRAQADSYNGAYYISGTGTFLIEYGRLVYIDENGNTYTEASETGSFDPDRQYRFALMGKNLIVVPDMKWIDIDTPTVVHSMDETWSVTSGTVKAVLCDREGKAYENVIESPNAPTNVGNLALWLDSSRIPRVLMQYTALTAEWTAIPTVYVKITGLGDHRFEDGDGVEISGLDGIAHDLNGSHVIQRVSHGEIVIIGTVDEDYEQDCAEKPVTIERKAPRLDFVVEAANRLWGCKRDVNEIYASKLGDFKNWNVFSGLSTDSWVGSVGSAGSFTGAVNQGGYPVFYKCAHKHKVWPSATGAHQVTAIPCVGVKASCAGSVATYGGSVLYVSGQGVYLDDGSGEVKISQALEPWSYSEGSGAVHGDKYYLSLGKTGTDTRELLVYDLVKRIWCQEDGEHITALVSAGKRLYAIDCGLHSCVWDLTGSRGTLEGKVLWSATTGDLMLSAPDHQYISRLTLRLSLEPESRLDIYARYDHEDRWVKLGTAYGRKPGSFTLPVRPRRCDHLQLKLEGQGMGKIYSITQTLEKGSELS